MSRGECCVLYIFDWVTAYTTKKMVLHIELVLSYGCLTAYFYVVTRLRILQIF